MEYVEREAAIAKCREIAACEWNHRASPVSWADAYEQFAEDIEELQSADVAPVRHARWIKHDDGVFTCSECENAESNESHFCRYCGAKMMEG